MLLEEMTADELAAVKTAKTAIIERSTARLERNAEPKKRGALMHQITIAKTVIAACERVERLRKGRRHEHI